MYKEEKEKMIKRLKADLSENYKDDEVVLSGLIDDYISLASDITNRKPTDVKIYPYVYTAVKKAYLRRGDEGSTSSSEGGLSTSYIDIEEKLKKDVMSIRLLKWEVQYEKI